MIEVQITVKPNSHQYIFSTYRVEVEYQDGTPVTKLYPEGDNRELSLDLLGLMIYQASPDAQEKMDVPIIDAYLEYFEDSVDADERVELFFERYAQFDFVGELESIKNIAVFYHNARGVVYECKLSLAILDEEEE